jgi:tripartite-type tricarboxylate transporter receptor subunit TctC
VLQSNRSKETLAKLGVDPAGGSPEVLSRQVETEVAKWVKVASEKNIKIEP